MSVVSRRSRTVGSGRSASAAYAVNVLCTLAVIILAAGQLVDAVLGLSGIGPLASRDEGPASETAVLGDGTSLSDLVSQVYTRNVTPRPNTGKVDPQSRSGLTRAPQTALRPQQPVAPPAPKPSPFALLFGGAGAANDAALQPAAPAPVVTYHTVCVRLCDGAYFPISYATTRDRFRHDEEACKSRCGSPAKLYAYRSSGGSPEDMEDIQGRAYRDLATAFQYRTTYDADCTCKPHPWEEASLQRHRMYAEAAAAKTAATASVAGVATDTGRPGGAAGNRARAATAAIVNGANAEAPQPDGGQTARVAPPWTPAMGLGAKNDPGNLKAKSKGKVTASIETADDIFRANLSR